MYTSACGDRGIVLGMDGQDLGLMTRLLGHDDEGRRTVTLDVELDAAQPFDPDVEREPIPRTDRKPPIGDDDLGVTCPSAGPDALVRGDHP